MTQAEPVAQPDTVLEKAILNANRALTQAGPVFWATFYGFVLIIAIAFGTSLMIQSVREREIARSERELESTVRLLSKQFDQHLEAFEAIPRSIAKYLAARSNNPEEFETLAASEQLHQLLREKISDSNDFAGVNVFDSDGNFLNSSEHGLSDAKHSLAGAMRSEASFLPRNSSPLLNNLVLLTSWGSMFFGRPVTRQQHGRNT